ncbi:MAG: SDR family oxidoreductase [Acidimicrobiia bacterium]
MTGSSRNLGATIARTLAQQGACVAVTFDSSRSEAEELVDSMPGGSHIALAFEAKSADSVVSLVQAAHDGLGGLDVLVNNVGPWAGEDIRTIPISDWRRVWDGNLTAAWVASIAALGYMEESGWGRIVNISAGSAFMRNHSAYGLAKHAMIALTEEMALAAAQGVTVNCIAPGQIAESIAELGSELGEDGAELVQRVLHRTPTGRMVTRQEVADVVALVCTETFGSMTGTTIPLDGGWRLNRE